MLDAKLCACDRALSEGKCECVYVQETVLVSVCVLSVCLELCVCECVCVSVSVWEWCKSRGGQASLKSGGLYP